MRVILVALGVNPEIQKFVPGQVAPLLPLMDRPFVQHVVERLSAQGADEFDVILSERPELFEELLGDGTRWGVRMTYHLVRDPERPWSVLKALRSPADPAASVILADAETLPLLELSLASPVPALLFHDGLWTGWGVVPWSSLTTVPGDTASQALPAILRQAGMGCQEAASCLSVRSYAELLQSSSAFFAGGGLGLLCQGHEVEPGIWLSRNVQIRPGARIEPPVYIGENSRIGRAMVGPGVVVGHDCVLDNDSSVRDSLILPGSYIGEGLEVQDSLVDRNCLVNFRVGAMLNVSEDFILGNLSHQPSGSWWQSWLARLFACGLLLPGLPLMLLFWGLRRLAGERCRWTSRQVACLPAPLESYRIAQVPLAEIGASTCSTLYFVDFLQRVVPGLFRVVAGGIHLTGIDPVSQEELEAMPHPRRNLCQRAKAGLISESLIVWGPFPSPDDRYAAESFYAFHAGFMHDLKLLSVYLWRVVSGRRLKRDGWECHKES